MTSAQPRPRIKVMSESQHYVHFTFRRHTFEIAKEYPDEPWYVIGKSESGSYVVDGWTPYEVENINQAIRWALEGAMLIK